MALKLFGFGALLLLAGAGLGCGDGEAPPLDWGNGPGEKGSDSVDDSDSGAEVVDTGESYETPTDTYGDKEPTVDCMDVGEGSGRLTARYANATVRVADSDKTYVLHTNWWYEHDGQTVTYDGLSFEVGNPENLDVGPDVGAPLGYPSLFIGHYAGLSSRESNLPIAVPDIESIPTVLRTNATTGGISNKNVSYDVWFTADAAPLPSDQYNPGRGGAYLMVWLFDPDDRQPRGTNRVPGHTVEGAPGSWDVWIDPSDPVCISYVSTDPLANLDFDLNDFIRDSVENEYGVTDDMHLSIVFAGFEIWGGADGITIDRFCADVRPK